MNYFLRRQDNDYDRCDGMFHEIKERDSLYKISRFYGISLSELMEKNPNVDVYNLKIGDKLCIPVKKMPYIVKKGDTLDWVLDHFKLDYDTLRNANPQMSPLMLEENEVIYIPGQGM